MRPIASYLHVLAAFALAALLLGFGASAAADPVPLAYDPLRLPSEAPPLPIDLAVRDAKRARDLPLRVYLPAGTAAAPVVLFSHGLGGSRENNPYLGKHWSARGYAVIFLQHPGSDEAVWRDAPPGQRSRALRQAASVRNFRLRAEDVRTVIDQLEIWNKTRENPLFGRLDLGRLGMSGHSFGAITTQAVSGQSFPLGIGLRYTDRRIRAALALSPSGPRQGDPATAFAKVESPWMVMTGTRDVASIGDIDVASRLEVFPALPPGGKYELVLEGAEHSAFNEHPLPYEREAQNPNHHRAILALSTAFWDAWLREDPAARAWLDGEGPRTVLEPGDRWQRK